MLLILVTFAVLLVHSGAYPWFPFGASTGDQLFRRVDDDYERISLTTRYRFYGQDYDQLFLSTNGFLTFGNGDASFVPRRLCESANPMIAPLWSDVYLPFRYGNLWFRQTADNDVLGRLEGIVEKFEKSCGCGFVAKSAFIATWETVASFCDTFGFFPFGRNEMNATFDASQAKEDMVNNGTDAGGRNFLPENTFQVALVTNGARKSYVIFLYEELEWDFCFAPNRAGFSPGRDSANVDNTCVEIDISELSAGSNIGEKGTWAFQTNPAKLKNPECDKQGGCC